MSDKLYPPIIESKLPPMILKEVSVNNEILQTFNLEIPFEFSNLITKDKISGFSIKISESMSNTKITDFKIIPDGTVITNQSYIDYENQIIYIKNQTYSSKDFFKNQFYKIQIAYISTPNEENEAEVGYYSTYGIVKCLDDSDFSIGILEFQNKDSGVTIYNSNKIKGYFTSNDLSETVLKYEFNLYDNGEIIESSGVQPHINLQNNYDISESFRTIYDEFYITLNLHPYQQYFIEYIVYTINGLKKSTGLQSFSTNDLFSLKFNAEINAEKDEDNSLIKIFIKPIELKSKYLIDAISMEGTYQLFRTDSKSNFTVWDHILNFKLPSLKYRQNQINDENIGLNENLKNYLVYVDYLLEQGIEYKYGVQIVFNDYSEKKQQSHKIILNNPISVNYETAYLYDKDYQLIVKYNPKVSSLKTTKLEQKIDTLGGVYPYFTRNYNTNYKEFPISGLISIIMDDQQLFNQGVLFYNNKLKNYYNNGIELDEDFYRQQTWSYDIETKNYNPTDLVGENFLQERDFKLKILDWLNNGKLKVFKSPGEGNYIVRLMNTSLAPNDTLGRMLHTFSCTAYEAAPYTYESLIENDLFSIETEIIGEINTEEIFPFEVSENLYIFDLSEYKYNKIYQIDFYNFPLNSEIKGYDEEENDKFTPFIYSFNAELFSIDENSFDLTNLIKITSDRINQNPQTYLKIYMNGYLNTYLNSLDELKYNKVAFKQYISESYDENNFSYIFTTDYFNPVIDNKRQSTYIYRAKFKRRNIETTNIDLSQYSNLKFSSDRVFESPLYLYQEGNQNKYWSQDIYGIIHCYTSIDNNIIINETDSIDLTNNNLEIREKLSDIFSIQIGNGCYCELSYPDNELIFVGEQDWRDKKEEDNTILCGYQNDFIFSLTPDSSDIYGDPIEYVSFNLDGDNIFTTTSQPEQTSNIIYIGLNCYNLLEQSENAQLERVFNNEEIKIKTQKNKQLENGKYYSDRHYVIEDIDEVEGI